METEVELGEKIGQTEAKESSKNSGITETNNNNNDANEAANFSLAAQLSVPNNNDDKSEEILEKIEEQPSSIAGGEEEPEKLDTMVANDASVNDTETNNIGANETVNSFLATQLSITSNNDDDKPKEIPNKIEKQPSPIAEGQEEPEKLDTTILNDPGVNDTDGLTQILPEIESVKELNQGKSSRMRSPRKRKPLTTGGIKKKRKRKCAKSKLEPTEMKFEKIETSDEPMNEILLSSLPNSIENYSMLNNETQKTASAVIRTNDANASGVRDEVLDEVTSSTYSTSNDVKKAEDVPQRRRRGRPRKNPIQSIVTEVNRNENLRNRAPSTASNEVLSPSDSMQTVSTLEDTAKENTVLPKFRKRSLEKGMKSRITISDNDSTSSIKNTTTETSLTYSIQTDPMFEDTTSKITSSSKRRSRVKSQREVIETEVSEVNKDGTKSEISEDKTAERLRKIDLTIDAVIQKVMRESQLEDLPEETKPEKIEIKIKPMLEKAISSEKIDTSQNGKRVEVDTLAPLTNADVISLDASKSRAAEWTCKNESSDNLTDEEIFAMYENMPKKVIKVKPISSGKSKTEIRSKNEITNEPECIMSPKRTKFDKIDIDNTPTNKIINYTSNESAEKKYKKLQTIQDSTADNMQVDNNLQIDKTTNTRSKSKSKDHSTNDISLIELKQLKVVLFDIAYSEKLTPAQKKMLLRMKLSNEIKRNVSLKNLQESSTDRSIGQSATVDTAKVSPNLEKTSTSGKPIRSVSRMKVKALKDEPLTPEKRQGPKTPKITTQYNFAKHKTQPGMHASRSNRAPPCGGSMPGIEFINIPSDTDFSLSNSSEINTHRKPRPFSRLSSSRGSPMRWSNIETKLTGQVALDCKDHEQRFKFETTESELPLNLSIRSPNKSMDCRSDIILTNPDTSTVKAASKTSNFSSPYHRHSLLDATTATKTKFGSSISNVIDLNTSLTNFRYYQNLSRARLTDYKPKEESDVNGNGKLQDIGHGKSTSVISTVTVSSGISENLKLPTEQTRAMHQLGKNDLMTHGAENVLVKNQPLFENANQKINIASATRCLPKIVSDKALPKGTILFPSVGCKSALQSNIEDKQDFNHANETQTNQERLGFQLSTHSRTSQQDNKITQTQSEKSTAKNEVADRNSTSAEPYDSSELWKICPELENFFEDEDNDDNINNNNNCIEKKIVNNINEKTKIDEHKLLDFDTLKTNETKNSDLLLGATKEIVSDRDLPLNNDAAHISETENYPRSLATGVVATYVNYMVNEMAEQSSESIKTDIISKIESETEKKKVVLANLTIANLTNFTKNASYDGEKDRLNSYVEHCHYSSYPETENCNEFSDRNKVSNIYDETCADTEIVSTSENQNRYPQGKAKTVKRKWIQGDNDTRCEQTSEKKRKLNRNISHGNTEGNSAIVCCFPIASSVESNNSKDSAKIVVTPTKLPEYTDCESKILDEKVKEKPTNILEEREIISSEFNVSQNQNLSIPDFDKTKNTPTSVAPADIIVSGGVDTMDYNCNNENIPKDGPCLTTPNTTVEKECNSELDENGNSTSSSSSSSSSSSVSSSEPTSNPEKTVSSTIINAENLSKDYRSRDKCQLRNEPEEELDYEPDDCISLFAESIISTHINDSLSFINDVSAYDPPIKPQDSFHCMTNVSNYFEKNIQECNAAYESVIEMDRNRQAAGLNDTPDVFARIDGPKFDIFSCNKSPIKQANTERKNMRKLVEYSAPDSPQERDDPETLVDLKSGFSVDMDSVNNFPTYLKVGDLFKGHCFSKMRHGLCGKIECRFSHRLLSTLQNIDQRDISEINEIFDHAIARGYKYFTTHVYRELFVRMETEKIFLIFYKLLIAQHIDDSIIKSTIDALANCGMPLRIIVKNIANQIDENYIFPMEQIFSIIESQIEPGTYWETFRDLLIIEHPPALGLHKVIEECVLANKDKSHIRDVYMNYVRKFTAEQLSHLNRHLKERFDSLVAENELINEIENFNFGYGSPFVENTNFHTISETQVSAQFNRKQGCEIPTILSPDGTQQFLPQKNIQVSQRSSSQGSYASRLLEKNENSSSPNKASTHNFFNQRRDTVSQVGPAIKHDSFDLSIRTQTIESDNSLDGNYKIHPIDGLTPPRSAYRDRHCDFHLSIIIIKELLKNQDYVTVLNMLNKYSDNMDKTLFTTSLYNVLRSNVISSAHHLKNLIKLSVKMGIGKFLNRILFTLGIYTMIKLCDTGTWVLAYDLFKFLRNTGSLENIAAITLISAEICLANGHPLKAFNMLKCNNMFTANRSKWRLDSNPNDEHVRLRIISLLSDVLCKEYPERAFYLFKQLRREQGHTYYPTDLTAIIDKLVIGIINGKCSELITEVGRFVIKSNFALGHCVFRNLVVKIFEIDARLSRQLYHYSSWLGIYPIVKLTLPLHILIKTNWTKEEMYLVIVDFLEKLSMDVGPAIDRIGPNKFTIHLVFELSPFEEQLIDNEVQMRNIDELKMSKKLMKTVLQEQFNPSINTIRAEQERFVKLQSKSVVNYLKSMNMRQ